jgi:hypothetical protein
VVKAKRTGYDLLLQLRNFWGLGYKALYDIGGRGLSQFVFPFSSASLSLSAGSKGVNHHVGLKRKKKDSIP